MKKNLFSALFVLIAALVVSPAFAWQGYNADLFRPTMFGGNFISIEDSHILDQYSFGGMLLYDYADSPYRYFSDRSFDSEKFEFLSEVHTARVSAAFGIFNFMSIGGELPIHFFTRLREPDSIYPLDMTSTIKEANIDSNGDVSYKMKDYEEKTVIGDARAELKFRLLKQENHWLGMALGPYMTFPTGDEKVFLGEGRNTGGATLAVEHDFDFINLGLNGGYQYRSGNGEKDVNKVINTYAGDAIKFGGGLSKGFENGLSFSIEYFGSWFDVDDRRAFHRRQIFEVGKKSYMESTGEFLGTIRYQFGKNGPRLIAGGGPGLGHNEGTPEYRLLGGVDYYYKKEAVTTGDLYVMAVDEKGEAIDAYMKVSGPKGSVYQGALEETGWKQALGAGRYDITVSKEGYQTEATDREVKLGETENVKLTLKEIPKVVKPTVFLLSFYDQCTNEALSGTVALKDAEGATKTYDVINGKLKTDVAAGEYDAVFSSKAYESKKMKVIVAKEQDNPVEVKLLHKIEALGKVYFATGSDVILKKSYPVLDNVVEQIKKFCQFDKVTIEGHTDAQGNDASNQKLSDRRAASVKKYLASKGIDAAKLVAVGFGETKPVDNNDTAAGRESNRRVEFVVE